MEENSALSIFPKSRLKPYDGMSVTAEAWALAHEEHRRARQGHDLFLHGSGVVWGLEVTANDPPDQYVFISPGAAIDPAGNLIVVSEPVAYDFGSTVEGPLYLLLGHGEHETGGVEKDIRLVHSEFVIAARPTLPRRPAVELARLVLPAAGRPVANAAQPARPAPGELDLRFRILLTPRASRVVYVGLVGLGKDVPEVRAGWDFLAAACAQAGYHLVVDEIAAQSKSWAVYDFVYAYGRGTFKLDTGETRAWTDYFEAGKTLFAEALDNAAEVSFQSVFEKVGLTLQPLAAGAGVLQSPFLFTAPPAGGANGAALQVGKQVIFSGFAYSLAWAGIFPGGGASRADIRAAHEWGINLLAHIVGQRGG